MKKINYIFLFLLLSCFIKAQTFSWAKSGVSNSLDEGYSTSIDGMGNVFITGFYTGASITFSPITLTYTVGNINSYLTKYDPNGNVLWSKSTDGGVNMSNSVKTDNIGNVYITGNFQGSNIFFDPVNSLANSGNQDVFIAKYDPNGNFLWARQSIGSSLEDATSVYTDNAGNVFITGYFKGASVNFGPYTLINTGSQSVFIVKYDPNGNVLWAKGSSGTSTDWSNSVCVDNNGNSIITGYYNSSMISFGSYTLTNSGMQDLFIVKYDPNGNVLWANTYGSAISNDVANSISSDAFNNLYITGNFDGSKINFGLDTLNNNAVQSVFLVRFDPNGNAIWAKGPSSSFSGYDWGLCVSVSSCGIFFTGGFTSIPLTFGTYTLNPSVSAPDPMFIAHYDYSGNILNATFLESGGDDVNGINADNFGNIYITSDFQASPFIVGLDTLQLIGSAFENVFVAKINFSCLSTNSNEFQNRKMNNELYPIPSINEITIKTDLKNGDKGKLEIRDITGRKLYEAELYSETKVDISNFASGTYIANIYLNGSLVKTRKFVKVE